MKYLYALIGLVLITSCASLEPTVKQYDYEGNRLSIVRMGCSLKLTFMNNSNESIRLAGKIFVLQNGAVIAENYVNWDSSTVLPNTLVRGTSSVGDGDDEYYISPQGLGCVNSTYKHNITIYKL